MATSTTTTTPATPWSLSRSALEASSGRFATMLRSCGDASAPSVGTWSLGEAAAHVLVVCSFDASAATGADPMPELAGLTDRVRKTRVDGVEEMNRECLDRVTERDPGVLADRIEVAVAGALSASASADGNERIAWLGGLELSRTGVFAHLVSELLVHGHDIARAAGRPWVVPSAEAALTFEHFLVDLLANNADVLAPQTTDPATRDVTCEFRVRGCAPVVFAVEGGRMRVEQPDTKAPDVRMTADAAALLLVMYRRISPLGPALRGRIRVTGRRPWRLGRLMKAMKLP